MFHSSSTHSWLLLLIRKGRIEEVRDIIKSKSFLFSPTFANGYLLLREALEYRQKEIAKLLLNEGVSISSKKTCSPVLYLAVQYGYTDVVQMLLNRNADVNYRGDFDQVPLHLAAERGNIEICRLLLRKNSNPNVRDRMGCCPLHHAARRGFLEIAKELVTYGASINSSASALNCEGLTPLHSAINGGHGEIVKLLLQRGANTNSKDRDGSTSLHLAAKKGHLGIAKDLIEYGASINSSASALNCEGLTPLHSAINGGHGEIVKLLLQRGANTNSKDRDGSTSLHLAAKKGHLGIAKDLIEYGASINSSISALNCEGLTPLHYAIKGGHGEIVKLLLESGGDANSKDKNGSTSLHLAVEVRQLGIVKDLIMHGVSVNSSLTSSYKKGYTPLHFASCNGDTLQLAQVVKLLIDNGAVVNATAEDDLKPLHIAVRERCMRIVTILLDHGAEVDSEDSKGSTPLYYAVSVGCLSLIKVILQHCPNVNVKSNKLAFHLAIHKQREIAEHFLDYGFMVGTEDVNDSELLQGSVKNGLTKIVEDLLHYGADINNSCNEGYTLLHTAAEKGHKEIARLLVNYGANVNAKDKIGRTPMYYSVNGGSIEITKLFLSSGVNANERFSMNAIRVVNVVTALNIAVLQDDEKMVELLLEHNANVNAIDENFLSPLLLAAKSNGNVAIIKSLLEYGADVNYKDRNGKTALMFILQNRFLEGVKHLLNYGAYINVIVDGMTPLEIAIISIRDSDRLSSKTIGVIEHIILHMLKIQPIYCIGDEPIALDKPCDWPKDCEWLRISEWSKDYESIKSEHIWNFPWMCEDELLELMHQKISGSVSFYDLLLDDVNQVAAYLRNENIAQVLDSGEYKTKFPIHAEILDFKVLRGRKRNELLECASKVLCYCSKYILSYAVVIQVILPYLDVQDLIVLTKCVQQNEMKF